MTEAFERQLGSFSNDDDDDDDDDDERRRRRRRQGERQKHNRFIK